MVPVVVVVVVPVVVVKPVLSMPPPVPKVDVVVGDGGAGDRDRAAVIVDAASIENRRIAADGGVGDRQRAKVVIDGTAILGGPIVRRRLESTTDRLPELLKAPPTVAVPWVNVNPETVAVTPLSTRNRPTRPAAADGDYRA